MGWRGTGIFGGVRNVLLTIAVHVDSFQDREKILVDLGQRTTDSREFEIRRCGKGMVGEMEDRLQYHLGACVWRGGACESTLIIFGTKTDLISFRKFQVSFHILGDEQTRIRWYK
jgi:hypothetical protein